MVFNALDRTIPNMIYPKGTADNLLPTITEMIFKQHFSYMFLNLMARTKQNYLVIDVNDDSIMIFSYGIISHNYT